MTTEAALRTTIEPGLSVAPSPAGPGPTGLVGDPDLFAPTSVAETLERVVALARQTFGADGAGILLAREGGAAATAASGTQAGRADALQVHHHQGPGFHAIRGRQPVVSPELRFDSRWRFWAPQAADLGLRSVLSLALTDNDSFGALSLYSRRPSFFGSGSLAPGLEFAQQASVAITVALEQERLARAADSRSLIGQAQGLLMERYQITADQALAVIRRSSSAFHQKLLSIAERIIGDRSLSDIDFIALPYLVHATRTGDGLDRDR